VLLDCGLGGGDGVDKNYERRPAKARNLVGAIANYATTNRAVSGRNKAMKRRQVPESILRSQKIKRHPGDSARTPPRIGPTAVAMFGLR